MRRFREEKEDDGYMDSRDRSVKGKMAVIMVILSAIAFVLLAIFADQDEMVPLDEAEGATVASEEKNGEIIHPTTIDAFMAPNFASDEDGGVWVIEALPVPEEWKERRTREE